MIISSTPLRFSLIGGGTDLECFWRNYRDSEFVSLTLRLFIHTTRIESVFDSLLFNKDAIRIPKYHEIPNEIVRTIILKSVINGHWDISGHLNINSDIISAGSGLGTSSALIVSLLHNLNPDWSPDELCREANYYEIDVLKNPIGWQDAMASSWGGLRYYRITKDGSYVTTRFNDYIGHELCDHILAFQLPNSKSANSDVLIKSPNHQEMIKDIENRLGLYYQTLDMVSPMCDALQKKDFKLVGNMLYDAWLLKRETHNTKNIMLDEICNAGMEEGAWGVKVTGSLNNNSGCIFFICPNEKIVMGAIRQRLKSLAEIPIYFETEGSRVVCIERG
jgi:D-glycero-alpha-D-manno-heptose-7-phosphate kinase